MERYAMTVVVEAADAEAAMEFAREELLGGEAGPVFADGAGVVYLGDPCLLADGETAYPTPSQDA